MTTATADPRTALLHAVIDAVAGAGLGSRSLRDIARAAGTSHRMLIHHFRSREGLFIAIVTEVEARQREVFRSLPADATTLPTMWRRLADPALWPFERLFFECYARGAQGEPPFDRFAARLVADWLDLFPGGPRRDEARLALAVVRGLLLDLIATEDRRGVDRAFARFAALVS